MTTRFRLAAFVFAALCLIGAKAGQAADNTTLDRMPADLETRYALSAVPQHMRAEATVYLLDPQSGYHLSRQGTNGISCLVERTSWDLADFRNDIYFALCYDAEGSKTYLQHIMDVAALRVKGMGPQELKAEIEKRYREKIYKVPQKPGLSYMIGPIMRTIGPPDRKVMSMAMPHLMFYAPNLTNEDIGAKVDFAVPESLLNPFVDKQGIAEHSYIIQMIGAAEKAKILENEKQLLADLCAYRDVLCLPHMEH